MPQGKTIPVQPGEYPELDGLNDGATVDFQGTARLVKTGGAEEGGGMSLEITNIELTPADNEATSELNRMTGNASAAAPKKEYATGGGF